MNIKKIFALAALAVLISVPSFAADMALKAPPVPVDPPSNWAGLYIGVEGGGIWDKTRFFDPPPGATTNQFWQHGAFVGGTVGENVVVNNLLLGFEIDMAWSDLQGRTTVACAAGCADKMFWLNTDRARVGWLFGAQKQYLAYLTAGAMGTRIQSSLGGCPSASCGIATVFTPVVGGGLEAMILPKLSVKVEYLYADFSDRVYFSAGIPIFTSERHVNIVRGGLNWHL